MPKFVKVLRVLVMAFGVTAIGACNTMEGVGQDLEQVGKKIEESAR